MMATTIPDRSGDLSHHARIDPITKSVKITVEPSVDPMFLVEVFPKRSSTTGGLASDAAVWLKRLATLEPFTSAGTTENRNLFR